MIDTKQVELKSKALTDFQFSMKHYLTHFNYAKVAINGEKNLQHLSHRKKQTS